MRCPRPDKPERGENLLLDVNGDLVERVAARLLPWTDNSSGTEGSVRGRASSLQGSHNLQKRTHR